MSAAPPRTRRVDESMSLITELMEGSLEPSYAAAAARRQAAGKPRATSVNSPTVLVVSIVVGAMLAVSAGVLRSASGVVGQARTQLEEQITARRDHGDAQADRIRALDEEIAALRAAALGPEQAELLGRLRQLQIVTGAVAVTGPGVVVTLDDATDTAGSNSDPRAGNGFGTSRVNAVDLQIVVNGLWASGAEAVAINGQRMTSRAAIRFAGEAILVDFRPLTRPYVVTAIGRAGGLQTTFASSAAGAYLKAIGDNYGIQTLIQAGDSLTCPAAPASELRYAQPVPSGIPSTSATTRPTPPRTTSPRPTETRR
ncbi:MAG TPA: DUF881 domain-containing protein [Microthrixaceae bacterium]|nr:DUF881 domain-containing protein [Microthrixaceae bacterium]